MTLQGCYYMQAVKGQLEVLGRREPLDQVIADPETDPGLAARLELLRQARRFASEQLLLPDNDSYRSYADLNRNYAVWNVVAAPEFSLQPKTWCYLVVGCLAYRGYFSQAAAMRAARKLRLDGFDVFVAGVAAYSTLGRFADPFLNTMMRRDDAELVSLLFHELAHQCLYVKGDTEFNESFASAVAVVGIKRWLQSRGDRDALARWRNRQQITAALAGLVRTAVDDLERLYASELPEAAMRRQKEMRLKRLAADAEQLTGGARWPDSELNNARLASMTLYSGRVDAFLALLDDCDGELRCFYRRAEAIAALPAEERKAALAAGR